MDDRNLLARTTKLEIAYTESGPADGPPGMLVHGCPAAVADNPKRFARFQWDTWSAPGWFDEDEFARTAAAFDIPDWVPITLNGYRRRWREGEVSDPAYAALREKLATIDQLSTPT